MISPRWRWEAAQRAKEFHESQASVELRASDPCTKFAYRFSYAQKLRRAFVEDRADAMQTAYLIYMTKPNIRRYIECMILAGCEDNARIAEMCDIEEDAVALYHDVFFDVRPRLHKEAWICDQFFSGETYRPVARHDLDGMYHRLAWLGGEELFRTMIGKVPDSVRERLADKIHEVLKQMLQRQCLLIAHTMGHGGEMGLETMRMALELLNNSVKEALPAHQKEVSTLQMQIQAFLGKAPLSVADPAIHTNLLTAEGFEPRATSTFVQEPEHAEVHA